MDKVSFIIPNLNGGQMLIDCLHSIYQNLSLPFEVIIVDNGSTDNSIKIAKEKYPDIIIIQLTANHGFARAVNKAIKITIANYICILNNDTILTKDCIEKIIDNMQRFKDCGIASPQLLDKYGRLQNSIAVFPNFLTEFGLKSLLKILFPQKFYHKKKPPKNPVQVESVIGACIVVKKDVFERIGLFDENYFVFLEETDLCYRAKKAGINTYFIPQAKLYHLQGQTKERMLIRASIEYARSMGLFFKKNYGIVAFYLFKFLSLIKFASMFLLLFIINLITAFTTKLYRRRFLITTNLLLWHLLLCPQDMCLKRPSTKYIKLKKGDRVIFQKEQSPVLDIDKILSCGKVVKEFRIKKLLQSSMGDTSYIIKIYKHCKLVDFVRAQVGICKAFKELKSYLRLESLSIDTNLPVCAVLEKKQNFLIFEKLDGWVPMELYLKDTSVSQSRRRYTIYLYGQFARKLHDACVFQYDFDPNNTLVSPDGLEFKLIDCEKVSFPVNLSLTDRLKCLAKTNRFRYASIPEKLQFLKGYFSIDCVSWKELKYYAQKINSYWQDVIKRMTRRIRKNCVNENRNFGKFKYGKVKGFYRKKREDVKRDGFEKEEVEKIISQDFNLPNIGCIKSTDIIRDWQEANVRAVLDMAPVPYAAVSFSGRKGVLIYKKAN